MRAVAIDVQGQMDWLDLPIARKKVDIRLVNCRPYGAKGMLQYLEISSKDGIETVISEIKSNRNILDSEFARLDKSRASGFLVTKSSPVCRWIAKYKGFCTSCPISDDQQRNRLRIVFGNKAELNQVLSGLEREGFSAKVTETEPPLSGTLTYAQNIILGIAEQQGFFEFPRKVNLTTLAQRLHMSKSNLEEILRRAEAKIVLDYVK